MDIFALVLSIISVIVSVIIAISQFKENRKISNVALDSDYFDYLFKELLLKSIPTDRALLAFDKDGKITGDNDFSNTLRLIRKNAVYFKYMDNVFYKKLRIQLQKIEDLLDNTANRNLLFDEQTQFYKELEIDIANMYKLMQKKYKGERIK